MPLRLAAAIAIFLAAAWLVPAPGEAAFPGRNGKIAFERLLENGNENFRWVHDVFVASPDGSGEVNVTNFEADERLPVWSADGTRIVYGQWTAVLAINPDGTGRTGLTFGGEPSWSPDGTRLVMTKQTHHNWPWNYDIFVVGSSDGVWGTPTNITGDPPGEAPDEFNPRWSPDGSRIAFISNRADVAHNLYNVYTARPDGTDVFRVTYLTDARNPDWSPDGRRLVLTGRRWDSAIGWVSGVFVIDADGTDLRLITSGSVRHPVWSPDGTQIAFEREGAARPDIWVMNADGTGQRRAIENGGAPNWQPLVNHPPECRSATATPGVFERVNREMAPVRVEGVSDPDGDAVDVRVASVTQDEPVRAPGDDTAPDAARGGDPRGVELRAERNPHGDGRAYRVSFEATDGRGGRCEDTVAVLVRRHKNALAVDSAPPSYDSFGG